MSVTDTTSGLSLNDILAKANKSQSVANFYGSVGFEALGGSPNDLREFQQAETQKWGKIVKAAGIEKE